MKTMTMIMDEVRIEQRVADLCADLCNLWGHLQSAESNIEHYTNTLGVSHPEVQSYVRIYERCRVEYAQLQHTLKNYPAWMVEKHTV